MKRKLMLITAAVLAAMMSMTGCAAKPDVENPAASGNTATETQAEETTETAETKADETAETETAAEGETKAADTEELIQLTGVREGETVATLHTNMGDISLRLFPQYAPLAVENFVTHAKDGYYDGVTFHRVIKEFMIQAGDPEGTGAGGESIWGKPFKNEVSPSLRNFRGALCMANAGADTNSSQFYIVQCTDIGDDLKSQLEQMRDEKDERFSSAVIDEYINNGGCPYLDFGYTVFGQVYAGMDVVDSIAAVETGENDKPLKDVIIDSIEVSEYGK